MNYYLESLIELIKVPFLNQEALWIITPLIIATTIMFLYFLVHYEEELGWNSAVANSLVYLFVSLNLLKYIFEIPPVDVSNLTIYISKTVLSLVLFFLGIIFLLLNFEHVLPKKVSYYLSSPLTINLFAYIVIVFVYSSLTFNMVVLLTMISLFILLRLLLYLVQIPLKKLFKNLKTLKENEKIELLKQGKKNIDKEKKKIKEKERKLKQIKISELKKTKKKKKKIKRISK